MAPAAKQLVARPTPGRKKRSENVYFEPGVQGRKTGITIKDTGRRDEHGFEPLDAIFSSPEKSPPKKPTVIATNEHAKSSSSVEVVQGSVPELSEVVSARRLTRSARTSLPPPKARSPMKTSLGSSPQRHPSLAPPSTARPTIGSPLRAKQIASVRRRLDFSEVPPQGIEINSPKVNGYHEDVGVENIAPPTDDQDDIFPPQEVDESIHMLNGVDDIPNVMEETPDTRSANKPTNHTPVPSTGRITAKGKSTAKSRASAQSSVHSTPDTVESLKRKRGRPSKSKAASKLASVEQAPEAPVQEESTLPMFDETVIDPSLLSMQDDTMAGAMPADEPEPSISIEIEAPTAMLPPPKPTTKKSKINVHRDSMDSATEDERPSKRARRSPAEPTPQKKGPGRPKNSSKAPKARDPNVRKAPAKKKATKDLPEDDYGSDEPKARSVRATSTTSVQGRAARGTSKPRSLQILRQGTPMEEPGAMRTRSGRQSVQPLAWWCGERVNRDFDGTIKDVIRAETVDRSPRAAKNKGSRKPKKALDDIEEEDVEDADDLEPWEEDGGILTGLVRGWDTEYNMTMEDEDVEMEIAFASTSIQTRDVMGATFSYAKIMTMPFFGAGVVDIPPGGFKRAKNSRKMQMIFFVHTGKVLVTVADLEFSISKGGAWQVPRGNFYSIENKGMRPARIFFSQGQDMAATLGDEGGQ